MDKLKKWIIIIFIIVIILIAVLLIFFNKNSNKDDEIDQNVLNEKYRKEIEENPEEEIPSDYNVEIETVDYNIIKNSISAYFQKLNLNSITYHSMTGEGAYTDKEINEIIINLLSDTYIKSKNITADSLRNTIKVYEEEIYFVPLKIKLLNDGNQRSYAVQGIIENSDYKFIDNVCLIVNVDYNNETYSIQPEEREYDEIVSISKSEEIEKNSYNKFNRGRVNTQNIVTDYLNIFKRLVLVRPSILYEYLDKEYREKRFGSYENFRTYVRKNIQEIKDLELEEYLVNSYDNYLEYVAKDKYGNLYIFKENKIMDYTIQLDDYTLQDNDEEFLKEYKAATDQYKMANNINKWKKMINSRDYKAAYEVLDNGFKNKNFDTLEKFEEYMKNNFPLHYDIEYGKFEEVTGEVYSQEVILTDITKETKDKIEKTILMKLGEGTEFVMSFNI